MFLGNSLQARVTSDTTSNTTTTSAAVKIAVDGSPLRVISKGPRVSFVHKSVFEYLAACSLISEVLASPPTSSAASVSPMLTQRVLRDQPGLVEFAALLTRRNAAVQQRLLSVVEASKAHPELALAAGNAFTVLNAARFSFSKRDLRKVRLFGADMRAAYLHRTTLDHADLRGALLAEAILAGASFKQCNMRDVEFSQQPDVDEQTTAVHKLHVFGQGAKARALTVTEGKHINYFALNSMKKGQASTEASVHLVSTVPLAAAVPHGEKDRHLPFVTSSSWDALCTMASPKELSVARLPGTEDKHSASVPTWTFNVEDDVVVGTAWPFRTSIRVADGGSRVAMVLRNRTVQVHESSGSGGKCIFKKSLDSDLTKLYYRTHHKGSCVRV